ncbi:MAG TPA: VanZ family protein [Vicinamibacterales bacterium]
MRVGIDIDGVLADMTGAIARGVDASAPDFWERLDEIEPGMVRQLSATAAAEGWEVLFLTKRPETKGAPAKIQTERWLERHGFAEPRVHIVPGSRAKAVRELDVELLIDDTLENCVDTALESKAASILIWSGDDTHARRSLRGLNVGLARCLGDVLEQRTGRMLDRSARADTSAAARPPAALVAAAAKVDAGRAAVPTRRTYALAALMFAVFAVYGSLVPLEFQAVDLDEAIERFSRVPYLQLGIQSRADFVANILLFVPLGFLVMGALRADRTGRGAMLATGAVVAAGACALANAIEFTQIFFRMRTVSLNDIVAETVGAAIGISVWALAGRRATAFARAFLAERERPALMVRVLAVYAAGFLVAQLLPLDIAITPGEMSEKYHAGRIVIVPFTYPYASALHALWDLVTDIVLNAPVGALAVVGWTALNRRRSLVAAAMLGATFVAIVEVAQLFIFSRYSDATDLITGTVGILAGAMLAVRSVRDEQSAPPSPRLQLWAAVGAVLWAAGLVGYHWYPFDFVVTGAMKAAQLPLLLSVPFRHYYFGSEFHAFTELSRKLMLAAPFGALVWMAWPVRSHFAQRLKSAVIVSSALVFYAALEAGQVFLPGRIPDLTDACVGAIGVGAGIWLVRLFERPHAMAVHPC